jgi:hypothetical protein
MGIQVLSLYFEWCHKLRNGEQRPPHISILYHCCWRATVIS